MNSAGIQDWILKNIVPLVLVVIGLGILAKSKKGNWSETMNTTGIAVIGIMFIVAAGAFIAFGEKMAKVVFN